MDVNEVIDKARESITVRKVFGQPIHQGDVTLVPAAMVRGGGGGGGGEGTSPEGAEGKEGVGSSGKGYGSGFGLRARPAGAFVLRGNKALWMPAVDVNRIVLGAQILMGLFLLTFGPRLARQLLPDERRRWRRLAR